MAVGLRYVTADLVDAIIRNQDIQDAEVYEVLASPEFDYYVPALLEELGMDEDAATEEVFEKEGWSGVAGTVAFDQGLREMMRNRALDEQDAVMDLVEEGEIELFREIRLNTGPESLRSTLSTELGECWTPDPDKAHSYYGEEMPHAYVFHAIAPESAIDWENTLIRRCNLSIGEEENEVTLIKGSRIDLLEIVHKHKGASANIDFADWLPKKITV